jgi:dolichol-phosphate mannosyltransferase
MTEVRNSVTIVCPIFNEENLIKPFLDKIVPILSKAIFDFEIIFCLDPCSDNSESIIERECRLDKRVKLIKFSQRVGQPKAIIAGIRNSTKQSVIIIDVDGQDPVEIIPDFLKFWQNGYDVVLGKRIRKRFKINRLIPSIGYYILGKFSQVPIESDVGEFRLIDKKIVDRMSHFNEYESFLRGLVSLTSANQKVINFERGNRLEGSTKYGFSLRSINIGLNGIIGFTSALLNLLFIIGLFLFIITFVLSIAVLVSKLNGFPFPIGNPTIVILILLIGSFNILSVSTIGLYIGRINEQVRNRPLYFIDKSVNFPEQE